MYKIVLSWNIHSTMLNHFGWDNRDIAKPLTFILSGSMYITQFISVQCQQKIYTWSYERSFDSGALPCFISQNQGKTTILSVLPKTTPLWFPVMHLNDVVMASIFSFWKDSRINFIMIILQNRHGSKVYKMYKFIFEWNGLQLYLIFTLKLQH